MAFGLMFWAFPVFSPAADWELKLDPQSTTISFTLGATFHTMEGTARLARSDIRFDPETGAVTGRVEVKTDSANTQNRSRDKKMHREILETQRYPEIVLLPHRFSGRFNPSGKSHLQLAADLKIHGGVHAVELEVHLYVKDGKLTGTASFPVPYVDWGMKDPSAFILRVRKVVHVELDLAGTVSLSSEAPAGPGSLR
ncbi:MAG: YceI family protein [Acidobacteriota bacterium]